jgi:simple sugar transport system ATP-binding protein
MMVGRKISFDQAPLSTYRNRTKLLEIRNGVMRKNHVPVLNGINLEVNGGEILGLAGVEGNGQTELIEALTGLTHLDEGQVLLAGRDVTKQSPIQMIESGIGHIPEDRNKLGLVGEFSIRDNLILGYHHRPSFQRFKVLKINHIKRYASQLRERFAIKSESIDTKVQALSGGNQQKVVIGRVLSQDPVVIIAAQPTRGVDIGAIEYIHQQLIEMRDQGKAVLLISAELDEIRKLSDKIAVIYEGRIVAYGPRDEFDEFELGSYMTRGKSIAETGKEKSADE